VLDLINNIKIHKPWNLLVIDDEPNVVAVLQEMLEGENYNITSAYSVAEAMSIIKRQNINIVLTDYLLGDGSGLEILQETKKLHPDSQIILMTGRPNIQSAVDVIRQGAYDYLVKPFGFEAAKLTLNRASEKIRLEQENIRLKELMSFYEISEATGSIIELDPLLNLILNTIVKEYEANVACIFICNPELGDLELKAFVGIEEGSFGKMVMDRCRELSRKSVARATPMIFDDPETEYEWGDRTIKSSMCQPLMAKGKTLGALVILRITNSHPFTQGQLAGLAILASKAATAVENNNLYENLKKTYIATVEALANAVEARDSYTRGHTERVYLLSCAIAEVLGWNKEELGDLKIGALLHDIGKIGVPDSILNKPGPLTPEEHEIMKRHPITGARMVDSIPFLKPALPYILYHHERHDGRGYPLGLKGDEIPLPGRLLAVVDTIDAITSDRPYRKGRPLSAAMDEIGLYSGTQFNPDVANACILVYKKGKLNFLFE
jgi:response regulator RpfG family c-di-GMP phosphodiesterase